MEFSLLINNARCQLNFAPFAFAQIKLNSPVNESLEKSIVLTEVNPAFLRLSGLKKKQLINKSLSEVSQLLKEHCFDLSFLCNHIKAGIINNIVETYSIALRKWYQIQISETQPGIFSLFFNDISAYKKVESELLSSISLLDAALESVSEGILVINLERQITKFNQRFMQMWQIPPEIFEVGDDLRLLNSIINKVAKPELFLNKINQLYRKPDLVSLDQIDLLDGRVFERFSQPQKLDGLIVGRVWSFRDVSENAFQAKSLNRAKEQFELAIAGTNDGIFDWDLRSNELFLSKRWKEILGYKDHELENKVKTFYDLINEEDKVRVSKYLTLYLAGKVDKYSIEFRMKHKDGSLRWILAKGEAVRDREGVPVRMAGSHSDITETKIAQESLKNSALFLKSVIESITHPLAVIDCETLEIKMANSAYGGNNAVGKKCYSVSHDFKQPCNSGDHPCPVKILKQSRKPFSVEHVHLINGEKRNVEIHAYPVFDEENNVVQIIEYSIDISERKEVERELLKAKKLAEAASKSKSEFLANMSHEIRTPLNGIIGFTDILNQTQLDEMQSQYVDYVNSSSKTLLAIVNEILDFSKIEAGKLELEILETHLVSLAEEAFDVINQLAVTKGLELIISISPKVPEVVLLDPLRVKQVLLNLLNNAVKFTKRGEIELKVSFSRDESETQTGVLTFSVRDTGQGISEESLKKLFLPFSQGDNSTTRKFGGTGLGLVISDMLVKKMGGEITVTSSEGKGSVFRFSIPVAIKEEGSEKFDSLPEGIRVLIFDDNATSLKALRSLFSSWNFHVSECARISDALALIQKNDHDFVFINYLEDQTDICRLLELVYEQPDFSPDKTNVVVLYNSVSGEKVKKLLNGFNVKFFVQKPLKRKHLQKVIEDALQIGTECNEILPEDQIASAQITIKSEKSPRILIVEDVQINMTLIKKLVEMIVPGVEISEAHDGREALEIISSNGDFDLILMDIQMPEIDGFEATRRIRAMDDVRLQKVPIVALTAGALKTEQENSVKAGMDDFLTKPISKKQLEETLEKYLGLMPAKDR